MEDLQGRTPTNFSHKWQKGDRVLVDSPKVRGSGVIHGFSITSNIRVKMDRPDSRKKRDFTVKPSECRPATESPTRQGGGPTSTNVDHKNMRVAVLTVRPEECEPVTRLKETVDSIHEAAAAKFQKDSHHQDDHQQRSSELEQRSNTARKPSIGEDNRKREQNSRTSESRQPNEGSLTASSAQQQPHRWKEGDPVFVPYYDKDGIVNSVTDDWINVELVDPLSKISVVLVKSKDCTNQRRLTDGGTSNRVGFGDKISGQNHIAAISNSLRPDCNITEKISINVFGFGTGDPVYVRKHRSYGVIREIYCKPYSENKRSGNGCDALSMEDYMVQVEMEQGPAFVRLSDCSLQVKANTFNERDGDAKAKLAAASKQDLSSRRDRPTDTEVKHSIESYDEIQQKCENCCNFMLFATVREKADKTYFSEITPVSLCGFDEYQKYGDELETSIREYISPPTDLRQYGGFWKGVQGDQNSGYMDASVFAMFSYLTVFDEIVKERQPSEDTANSKKIRQILRETIVSPLRKYGFVQKDSMHAFRQLLDELGLVKGLKGEEKDPEEFLNLLLANVFATPPPITLR